VVKATPSEKTFYVIAALFLTWFLLKTTPYTEGGLLKNLDVLNESLQHPFSFSFSFRSLKIVFLGLALYAAAVFGKENFKAKTRRKEEDPEFSLQIFP
jgi:hypothetical protein